MHPGINNGKLLTLEPDGNHFRQTDLDFWTSQLAQEFIQKEGIILMDYQALQAV